MCIRLICLPQGSSVPEILRELFARQTRIDDIRLLFNVKLAKGIVGAHQDVI